MGCGLGVFGWGDLNETGGGIKIWTSILSFDIEVAKTKVFQIPSLCVTVWSCIFQYSGADFSKHKILETMILKIEVLHTTNAGFQVCSSAAWCGGQPLTAKTQKTSTGHDFPKAKWLVETASLIQTRLSKATT